MIRLSAITPICSSAGSDRPFGGDALKTLGQLRPTHQTIKDAGRHLRWGEGQMQEVSPRCRRRWAKQFAVETRTVFRSCAGEAWSDPRAYWGNFATVMGQFVGFGLVVPRAGIVA